MRLSSLYETVTSGSIVMLDKPFFKEQDKTHPKRWYHKYASSKLKRKPLLINNKVKQCQKNEP